MLKNNSVYNSMPNNVKLLFKFAYDHNRMEYDFPEDTTIGEMIAFIQKRAYTDFEFFKLDPITYPYIKVVEMGQFKNVNGYDPELAPALQPSDQTLKERYNGKYERIGFYIRYSSKPMAIFESTFPPLEKVEPKA
jgi:hypothetical protein